MINEINLSAYQDRFSVSSISNIRKKNFIFGKNGTGKSTISQAILEQFSDEYDVRIFDGYNGIFGENERLDAIALGKKDVLIQEQIKQIDEDIKGLNLEIFPPMENQENLFSKLESANKKLTDQSAKMNKFFTDSARTISGLGNPRLVENARNYNKKSFEDEISKANRLSEDEIRENKRLLNAKQIILKEKLKFPTVDFLKFLSATNQILETNVTVSTVIKELDENIAKHNFAKEGNRIHTHLDVGGNKFHDEKCAFCGSKISEERWQILDNYFSTEVKKLDERVEKGIQTMKYEIEKIQTISQIHELDYYPNFQLRVKELNSEIILRQNECIQFFMILKEYLEDKKNKSLLVVDKIVMNVPTDFQTIETKYNILFDENNQFSSNLSTEKQKSRDTLRYHENMLKLVDFDYFNEITVLANYETTAKDLQTDFESKKHELHDKKIARQNLVSQSTDETMVAGNINKLLRGLGSKSFSLEHVDNPNEQKGQYKIRGSNGLLRSVTELSEGEKNIVAFLYFMNGMKSTTDKDYVQDKIIVLDDPMTSNDDVTQFLMMSVIQRYYGERESQSQMGKGDTLLILTHNTHFYLNVRPFKPRYKDGKNKTNEAYIFLKSDGSKTSIERITQDNDIKSGYDALWQELEFAYENDKTLFMWNNMRRIIETFAKFNNTEIAPLLSSFDNEQDNILGGLLRKSLNTNSHAILDFEFESDVFTKDQLLDFFSSAFEKLNASNHFNNYWKKGNEFVK